jgi:lysyl oxidase/Big-like domain-containing protein
MIRRRRLVPVLLAMGAAGAVVPIVASATADPVLPDLRADPPENLTVDPGSGRLLIRFDGFVTNIGQGPLDIEGNPQVAGGMQQYVGAVGALAPDHPVTVKYETNDSHNHFHLMQIMRYSLWNQSHTAEVAPGQKVGFCAVDSQPAPSPSPAPAAQTYSTEANGFCDWGDPGATFLQMGVSSGWRDRYYNGLAFQWVDASNVPPGVYSVAAQADPNGMIRESNETNPIAFMAKNVAVAGYVATPVGTVGVPGGAPSVITLGATAVGSPGVRGFRITKPPAHGTLDVPVNSTFAGSNVTYTPAPGYSGPDSFTYAAVNTSGTFKGFPLNPAQATATVQVGAPATVPTVQLSGVPAQMYAGTSVQLGASVSGAAPGVSWSSDGGSITPAGLFTAPEATGAIVVRATSTAAPNRFAEATIRVIAPPLPRPATLDSHPTPAIIGVKRHGRTILTRAAIPVRARVTVSIIRGHRVIARCSSRTRTVGAIACVVRLPPRFAHAPVRVAVGVRSSEGHRASISRLVR